MPTRLTTVLIVSLAALAATVTSVTAQVNAANHYLPTLFPDRPYLPRSRCYSRTHSYIPHPNPRRHRKVKGWMRDGRGRVVR